MGRNLHYSILQFFEKILNEHKMVISWERVDNSTENHDYLYLLHRANGLNDMIVLVSDEYRYSLTHYFQKPHEISEGSFIYIARPEAMYDFAIVEYAQQDKISIGKLSAIMGALYKEKHWNYVPKETIKT